MNLPKLTVKRPVTTVMAFLAVLMFGLVSLRMLPIDLMPNIELPTLTVITVYPGASAEEVEQQVSKPLEEVLAGTENLSRLNSISRENVSFISLQFNWGANISDAANNARDLMELAKSDLPADAHSPYIMKVNTSMLPVVIYGIGADENYQGLEKIIEEKISTPLHKVEGIGSTMFIAQPEREIKVHVNPVKLQAYNLSISQISSILQAENITIPGGNIKVGKNDFSVRVPGEINRISSLEDIVITALNGQVIRLKDVAEVQDGFKDKDEIAITQGKRSVAMFVQKQTGANTLEVYQRTTEKMNQIRTTLPPDVTITEVLNTSEIITESIGNLTSTIWWAAFFVVIVVFAFLRQWKTSLIVILTIPFSLIVAFITMLIADYTINIFSLMSLVIAIGMVVDNAIVVLENITRHVEEGAKPRQAAVFGTNEMGKAITASTFTTISVFLPMIFMGGIVGILFKQLALLTSVTLLASLITALALTPMLSSQLFKARKPEKSKKYSKIYQISENLFVRLDNFYRGNLKWALHHRLFVILIAIVLFGLTVFTALRLGSDYIPEFDAGDVMAVIETEVGTNVEETVEVAQQVADIFEEEVPEKVSGFILAGQTEQGLLSSVGFAEGKNVATVSVHLDLPQNRDRTAKEIAAVVRERIAGIPEISKYQVTGGSLMSSAVLGNVKPVEVKIFGNDFTKMNEVAENIKEKLAKQPGLINLETTVDKGKLEVEVLIDKQRASNLGLNTATIATQIRQSIYGASAGELKDQGDEYAINIRYAPEHRNGIEKLKNITLTTLTGQQIPISAVAEIREGVGMTQINRESQQRVVKINIDLHNISLGEAAKQVEQTIDSVSYPEGLTVELGGQVKDQETSFDDLYLVFIIGFLLVYMIMASQFESLKDPFVIIFAIPFSIIGVVLAFLVTGLTLSVVTFIGIIMLLGIVVNNGIVLIDYTNLLRARNYKLMDAVLEAGRSRLRPVLMTSFTTMLAMIPMAMSTGMGSEMWSPLGITIIGGLLISMLITLILVPVIYISIHYKSIEN